MAILKEKKKDCKITCWMDDEIGSSKTHQN